MSLAESGRGGARARIAAKLARVLGPIAPAYFSRGLRRPYFMVGSGRSGSTLLAGVLSRHASVAVFPSEANDLWHSKLYPWDSTKPIVAPIWIDPGQYSASSLRELDWSRVRGVFGAFQTVMGRPVFINKSMMLSFMISEIAKKIEDARFIHLVRDGRAVALSLAKKNLLKIKRNPGVYEEAGVNADLEALIIQSFRHWVDHIRAIEEADGNLNLTPSGRMLVLSYESLTADWRKALARVLEFLEVHALPDNFLIEPTDSKNQKFSDELSPAVHKAIAADGGNILRRYGYLI